VLAAFYSPAELSGIVAFMDTPAAAVLRPNADRDAVAEMLGRDTARRIQAEAGPAFCRDRSCDVAPVLQAPTKALIANPSWTQAPSQAVFERARPTVVRALGLAAAAQLVCRIDQLGTPSDCAVVAEAPAGLGVGAAASALASGLRLNPILMAQGAQGESVAVRVLFPKPDASEPYRPPAPRSARALTLARQLSATTPRPPIPPSAEQQLEALAKASAPGADPATMAAAVAALRTAMEHASTAYLDGMDSTVAAIFSEDQLAGALAFRRSPIGQAMAAREAQVDAALAAAAARSYAKVLADARALFCKDRPCEPTRPAPSMAAR
jgi:hypothetical protein